MELEQNVNVNEVEEVVETGVTTKTYTQEEVLAMIQSESDKRVTSALKKQSAKYEKQLSLSGLDDVSRQKAESELRIAELEEKLKEFNTMQTKNEVTKVLTNRGLNPQFADLILIGEDVEEAQGRIEQLDKLFKQAVKAEVEKRMGTTSPKTGTVKTEGMTKEEFNKLSLAQQTQLFKDNKDLYMSLI